MKKHYYYLLAGLALTLISCEEEGSVTNYVTSTISISVLNSNSNSASIALSSTKIKSLGPFTVGVCYSTTSEPTIQDTRIELNINPDTLSEDKLDLVFDITQLTKNTTYYVKGFILTNSNPIYSTQLNFKTESKTLTINVSDDYVPVGQEYWVVLSNKSTTIVTQKIENSQTYIFSDSIPAIADFHLFKWNPSTYNLYVESYTDIVPDEFNLDNPYKSSNVGEVSVTISDVANFLRWGIATSWWWYSTTSVTTNSLTTYLSKNPDDLFICYIPTSLSEAPKYKYVTNVTPGSMYSYTLSNLTTMTNFSNILLPANTYFYYNISGYNTDYYTDYKRYHGHSYTSGYSGTFKLYYPTGINTNYYFYAYYNTDNQQSFYNKLGSLPTTFFSTFPSITISNSDQFTTTTSSIENYLNYEVVDFYGYCSYLGTYIHWDYYKKTELLNSIQLPDFPDELKLQINYLTTDDIQFSDIGYIDILNSPVSSYNTYVDLLIKQSSRFYDVIKERRIYYQWISKKSNSNTHKINRLQEE